MSLAVIHSRALDGLDAPPVHGRGAPGQRAAELHAGRPGRHRSQGVARARARRAGQQRLRVPAQQAHHGQPGAGRPAQGVRPLRPADRARHPGRRRSARRRSGSARYEFAGELSLAGELRPVRGALALALALRRAGSRAHAGAAGGQRAARRRWSRGARRARARPPARRGARDAARRRGRSRCRWRTPLRGGSRAAPAPDLRDVKGQAGAKRALEIAAAGGHSLLMIGPARHRQVDAGAAPARPAAADGRRRGAGKRRAARAWRARLRRRALGPAAAARAAPHAPARSALVGGGSPPRPGEISLAHGGVLFLDELPEFPRAALEALREPLESGRITISRAARQAAFPARFQLVAAMNPCPCGWLGAPAGAGSAAAARRTAWRATRASCRARCSTASTCRSRCRPWRRATAGRCPTASAAPRSRDRVAAARERQLQRQGVVNARTRAGRDRHALRARRTGHAVCRRRRRAQLGWIGRSLHRVLKVARTIADLAGSGAHRQRPHRRGDAAAARPARVLRRRLSRRLTP